MKQAVDLLLSQSIAGGIVIGSRSAHSRRFATARQRPLGVRAMARSRHTSAASAAMARVAFDANRACAIA